MASKPHIRTMVFCPVKKKMVDKGTEQRVDAKGAPMIIGPLEPFKSPITGEEITSREQLRRHNREHGVTDSRDYSPQFMEQRQKEREQKSIGNTAADRADRINLLRQAVYRS